MALGAKLREARHKAPGKPSQRDVAAKLRLNQSEISRWESGERPPTSTEVARYLAILDVTGEELASVLAFADGDFDESPWLAVGMPAQQVQLKALLGFEQSSTDITDIAPLVIPGLAQTGDYARAIMRAAGKPQDEIVTHVTLRVGRSEILTRKKSPVQFRAFIGEAALQANIGGPEVMADQLDHLLTMGDLPNVSIHVFEIGADWHPGLDGPVVLLTTGKTRTVVYLETRRSGLFLQEEEDVTAYKSAVEKVLRISLNEAESAEFIRSVANQKR